MRVLCAVLGLLLSLTAAADGVRIDVPVEGPLRLDGKAVTPAELGAWLEGLDAKARASRRVVVAADPRVPYARLGLVLDRLQAAKVKRVVFAKLERTPTAVAAAAAEALARLTGRIAKDPTQVEAYLARAQALMRAARLDAARRDFQRAIELDPARAGAHLGLAELAQRQGRHAEAVAQLDRAIALDPQLTDAYRARGRARCSQGDYAAALADYETALRLDPRQADALLERARALVALGRLQEALVDVERSIECQAQAEAILERARILIRLGRIQEALGGLDEAIKQAPGLAPAYAERGLLLFRRGELTRALRDIDRALSLDPKLESARKAREALSKAIGARPATPATPARRSVAGTVQLRLTRSGRGVAGAVVRSVPFTSEAGLREQLASVPKASEVVIEADEDVPFSALVSALKILRARGVSRVVFAAGPRAAGARNTPRSDDEARRRSRADQAAAAAAALERFRKLHPEVNRFEDEQKRLTARMAQLKVSLAATLAQQAQLASQVGQLRQPANPTELLKLPLIAGSAEVVRLRAARVRLETELASLGSMGVPDDHADVTAVKRSLARNQREQVSAATTVRQRIEQRFAALRSSGDGLRGQLAGVTRDLDALHQRHAEYLRLRRDAAAAAKRLAGLPGGSGPTRVALPALPASRVLDVMPAQRRCLLGLGQRDGVEVGSVFVVSRQDKVIARVTVDRVWARLSTGPFEPGATMPRKGDRVSPAPGDR